MLAGLISPSTASGLANAPSEVTSIAPCAGYLISGAGSPSVDGCYHQRTTTLFALDDNHELYSWQGVWRLGCKGENVSYLAATPSAWPPITGGGCGADGWLQSAGEDPCPAVKRVNLPPAPPVPPPPPPPPVPPIPPLPPMRLVWEDDFDGSTLNESVWNVLEQVHRGGVYTRANVQVEGGVLTLRTIAQNLTIDQGGKPTSFYVSSGAVNTSRLREQRTGRWEARVKLPHVSASVGYTLHSSIWLFADMANPERSGCAQEIDVVEQYMAGTGSYLPSRATANLHPYNGTRHGSYGCRKEPYARPLRTTAIGDWTSRWTTFTVDWTDTFIAMSVDGQPYALFEPAASTIAAFTDPLFLALTACVMDRVFTSPRDVFPLEYLVDWVRVYEWAPPATPGAIERAPLATPSAVESVAVPNDEGDAIEISALPMTAVTTPCEEEFEATQVSAPPMPSHAHASTSLSSRWWFNFHNDDFVKQALSIVSAHRQSITGIYCYTGVSVAAGGVFHSPSADTIRLRVAPFVSLGLTVGAAIAVDQSAIEDGSALKAVAAAAAFANSAMLTSLMVDYEPRTNISRAHAEAYAAFVTSLAKALHSRNCKLEMCVSSWSILTEFSLYSKTGVDGMMSMAATYKGTNVSVNEGWVAEELLLEGVSRDQCRVGIGSTNSMYQKWDYNWTQTRLHSFVAYLVTHGVRHLDVWRTDIDALNATNGTDDWVYDTTAKFLQQSKCILPDDGDCDPSAPISGCCGMSACELRQPDRCGGPPTPPSPPIYKCVAPPPPPTPHCKALGDKCLADLDCCPDWDCGSILCNRSPPTPTHPHPTGTCLRRPLPPSSPRQPSAVVQPVTNISVLSAARTGKAIQPNFVGLSIEVPAMLSMIGATGNSSAMAQALRNLAELTPSPEHAGPVLRVGGNSADESCWDDAHTHGCAHRIRMEELVAYKSFAQGVARDLNLTYVIDTNFGVSPDPNVVAVGHIRALGKAGLWPLVRAIEIGNEIDIYAKSTPAQQKAKGHRNRSYTYLDYEPEFLAYVRAFRNAGMPHGRVQGGTYCALSNRGGFDANISRYVNLERAELRSFSYHRYPTSHCGTRNTSLAALLSDLSIRGQMLRLSPYVLEITSRGIEFWIGEGNSASCGGMPGVSDTFGAALWAADFLPTLARNNVSGFNFHGGPGGVYPPIAFDAGRLEVRPLYYGLLLFSAFAANWSTWLPLEVASSDDLPATGDNLCERGIFGGEACCEASCGVCGGTGCDQRPGGGAACCGGEILKANRSCDTHAAPCAINPESQRKPLGAHAVVDVHGVAKVLVVAKDLTQSAPRRVHVCLPAATKSRTGAVRFLVASSVTTKWQGDITYAGQTFNTSLNGRPSGTPSVLAVQGRPGPTAKEECFDFVLPSLAAALLEVVAGEPGLSVE